MDETQIRLLGPVDALVGGAPRPISGLRRKAVLSVLALQAGEVVSTDRLIDAVWNGDAPATAPNSLQSHLSFLRRLLSSKTSIQSRPLGYVLTIGPDATDVAVVERLVQQGLDTADFSVRASHLKAALALWRGEPLADVRGSAWLDDHVSRLTALRISTTEALIDAQLALGEHVALVPELERLARSHPFHERLHGQLMLALYRSGRQADSLSVFRRLRRTLEEELGVDPSVRLRTLEQAILRQDTSLDPPVAAAVIAPPRDQVVRPAELPRVVRSFTGRTQELARLDAVLAAGRSPDPSTVLIVGTAGVGKTSLAVYWAQCVAGRFPDGQIYINLRGFDPGGPMMTQTEALQRLLDGLGVPPQRMPVTPDAQAAMLRSTLAGKRALIVLDNARDASQVRPLLPGTPGCLVVVTSRNRLVPLIATEGAQLLALSPLSDSDAYELLERRLGVARIAAERLAVKEIVAHCEHLPLALAIAAAQAAADPSLSLEKLMVDLRESASRLDVLTAGDAATDLRAVFSWSYQALRPDTARLFRVLGLHPGPDFTPSAAASLMGTAVLSVQKMLAELTNAHLLDEHVTGRFAFHDLLRAFAREQAISADPDTDTDQFAPMRRLLDHYLHTSFAGARLLNGDREPIELAPPGDGVCWERPRDREAALAWFEAEHPGIYAAIEQAPAEFDKHRWQLAWTIVPYAYWQGKRPDAQVLHSARGAAARLADAIAEGHMERCLGVAASRVADHSSARDHFARSVEFFAASGNLEAQARSHGDLAAAAWELGRWDEASWHSEQALRTYRQLGHRAGEARMLNAIGWHAINRGDHIRAECLLARAFALHDQLGDRHGAAITMDSIGYAHHRSGRHREAIDKFTNALEIFRDIGDRYNEADTLTRLGEVHLDAGAVDAAYRTWSAAHAILDDLGHPGAGTIRRKLDACHANA